MTRVAILDDYQGAALLTADWASLPAGVNVVVFRDHAAEEGAVAARLADFDVVVAMRERTPFPRSLLDRLPRLRLLVTTGMRNAAIDFRAAADRVGRAFEMEVLAWSQNLTAERAAAVGASLVGRDELLTRANVVTIHLVLSERTRGLIGARELALMRPSAYLVNTSRGPIVEEQALIQALRAGAIAGAGLDVYDEEPLPADHPFRRLPNTVITPHLGYVTEETYRIFYAQALEDVHAYLAGMPVRLLRP